MNAAAYRSTLLPRLTAGVLTFATLATAPTTPAAEQLRTGDRLEVGGDGYGPLSLGISTYPLGLVQLPGTEQRSLFVVAGRFSHEPGLFVYDWNAATGPEAPTLTGRRAVSYPADLKQAPPPGTIFQTKSGHVYGFWLIDGALVRTRYVPADSAFVPLSTTALPIPRLPGAAPDQRKNADGRAVERIAISENADGSLELILSCADDISYLPAGGKSRRDPDFDPFDGRGVWRGGLPHVFLYQTRLPGPEAELTSWGKWRQASATRTEALFSHGHLSWANFGSGRESDLIAGSYFGNIYWYLAQHDASGLKLGRAALVQDMAGRAIRSPFVWTSPLAVPAGDRRGADLVVGGEGSLTYYRFGGFNEEGVPRYERPQPLRAEHQLLYTGSLPVLNSVDWDADGATDIVTGNSEGKILLFRNHGDDTAPDFGAAEALRAGDEEIHVQQGYPALQGPDEARWGYASPVVADWNGDRLPDILMSDATAQHRVLLNVGTRSAPALAPAHPLYCEGLDLHGTWRVRPGVEEWGGRMAYVALDDDDAFHLYWRIDDYNLSDAGKLLLEDGSPITANFLPAGATGRSKFTLADWDGDQVMDIIVGTPRHGAVPNPATGLPKAKGLPGAAILWLRNIGSNAAPRFAFPLLLHVKGRPVYFGQHECSAALTALGGEGGPHLLVGDEEGRIHFFNRKDVSWAP